MVNLSPVMVQALASLAVPLNKIGFLKIVILKTLIKVLNLATAVTSPPLKIIISPITINTVFTVLSTAMMSLLKIIKYLIINLTASSGLITVIALKSLPMNPSLTPVLVLTGMIMATILTSRKINHIATKAVAIPLTLLSLVLLLLKILPMTIKLMSVVLI